MLTGGGPQWASPLQNRWKMKWLGFFLSLWLGACSVFAADSGPVPCSVAELRNKMDGAARLIESFDLEGVVCAVAHERKLLILQDGSGSVLLEVPDLDESIRAGDRVRITCNHCAVTRGRFGIQLGTAPVVDNDGHHASVLKSGPVYLEAGMQPIRVTWFNGRNTSTLKTEYEGPGISRRVIPDTVLFRKPKQPGGLSTLETGLDFAAYTGDWIISFPDFRNLKPVAEGVATNFDLSYSVRKDGTALAFDGFIQIAAPGVYTFHLESDDGGMLYVGNPETTCRLSVMARGNPPTPKSFHEALLSGTNSVWAELKGEITFAAENENGLQLDLTGQSGAAQVDILESTRLSSASLTHRLARLTGILELVPDMGIGQRVRLVVPGSEQVNILIAPGPTIESATNSILTTVREIRRLAPAEARQTLPARINGVVIWASPIALVLQDATGGVYIQHKAEDWTEQPRVGESWEIEGTTDPGQFSPMLNANAGKFLGRATLPEPIRPSWDQVLDGSLDAEYVELRGALTEIAPDKLTLVTSEGKIQIGSMDDHSLPYLPELLDGQTYMDSIVRIRGCFTATWDFPARQVKPGVIFLSPGTVEVEEFAPRNPFNLPAKRVADLLLFDPSAALLRRTKVKGQITVAAAGDYRLQDEGAGLRLRTKEPLDLQVGDVVEAAGFLQVSGPSPGLQEARVQKVGMAALPVPITIAGAELRNNNHDSTRVVVEAMLLDDRTETGFRVLEMQAGQYHFNARLKQTLTNTPSLAAGCRLALTGIYLSAPDEKVGGNLDAFELWLNNASDIRVLAQPSWWTLRRALMIVAALCAVLGMAAVWITLLRRRVEERTIQLRKEVEERNLVEHRRAMEQERTRVAQDLHDELGAGLTEVGLLGDLVKNPVVPEPEKLHYLEQLTEIARSLVTSLDLIVWAINPRYDSVASLASYYTLFAQRFLNLAGVACRPQIPADFPHYPLDPKVRHGLFLAFKEALNNVVRHAGATEVRLKIEVLDDELVVWLADNGCGIQFSADTTGQEGIQGMRRRMEQLGGQCEIKSRPGEGTEVELRLPVRNMVL